MTFYWTKNTTLKKSECGQALHRVGSLENVYHMRILKSECWCVSFMNCLFMKNWKYYLCNIDRLRLQSWHVQATENAFLTEIADTKCVLIYRHCIVQWAVQPQQLTILLTNAQHILWLQDFKSLQNIISCSWLLFCWWIQVPMVNIACPWSLW